LSDTDFLALASFRYAVRRYLTFAESGAQTVGLTSLQHQALLAIKAHTLRSTMSIGDLAGELLVKHHSTVELVSRLEKAGYVKKEVDVEDRRRVLISLTAAGENVLAALSANNFKELRLIAPAFSGLLAQLDELASE
jgi:DNA-binding MarR family transcriptional regulator